MSCVAQTSPSASSALSGSTYLTMNKDHLPYSITLISYVKHEGACISKLHNETWGLPIEQSCSAGWSAPWVQVSRSSSTVLDFAMSPPALSKKKRFKRSTQDRLWLVVTMGESEIGHDDRETSTQGALDHAAQLCSIEDPTFHCKVLRYRHPYVLHMK
ncbi:predicted protein [Lichtheimia corymbifera JMRC:FSU:9682]|uniref:Uncharacterized protein n=1 Tax=Lichtheimia corymbifera JMRC:FSU:9682 TaxID=1263082 RepID=A0A068RJY5_9FUNG|nr:predicted protein [Lichtheimia corymbifera JMRC:FSU:9682]